MAIFVKTLDPAGLVRSIKQKIDNKKIDTWIYDKDGDFTHDTEQWRFHAWLRPFIETERVVFGILCNKNRDLTKSDYAIYHGRFLEVLLKYYDKDCLDIYVSPLGTKYDKIK